MEHEWPAHSNTKHSFHQLTAFVEIGLVFDGSNDNFAPGSWIKSK